MIGPRLSDLKFFESLDLKVSALSAVKQAVEQEDWWRARKELAAHMRSRRKPIWFFNWRERTTLENQDMEDDLVKKADKIVHNSLTSCQVLHEFGLQIDWELNPIDYKEWTWQLSRHPFWVILGQVYWNTGDERYSAAFVRQMRHWIEHVLVPKGEDGNSWKFSANMGNDQTNCWRTIECGIRMGQTWPSAFFYFLSSPSFTDDALCLMLKSMVEQVRHLIQWPRKGNWSTMEANGIYHVGVLFPEFKEAVEWRQLAMDRLYRELDEQVYPDGAQIELSSGYHQVSLKNFVKAYNLGQLNEQEMPKDYLSKLERMYNYNLYMVMPNFQLPALNDGDQIKIKPYMEEGFRFFPHRTDFQWAATTGKEGIKPETFSCAFPYAGHFVMRTGWERDDMYLFFDGGPFGFGHQHEDKLNIVACSNGRVQIVDPGNYPYNSSPWREYVISTRAHNTVMVDGMEQGRKGESPESYLVSEPLPHTWVSEPYFDYASASYNNGYGPARDRTVTHTRSILFVKPDFWIVADFLNPSNNLPHTYEAMFHLDSKETKVVGNGRGIETRNDVGGDFGIYTLANEEIEIKVVSGQMEPDVQGWIPRGGPYECQPIPTAIFSTEGSGTIVMAYVLCPKPEGTFPLVSYMEHIPSLSENLSSVAGRIMLLDGREIYFVLREPGKGRVQGGEGETDAEALAVVIASSGKIDRIFMANGTEFLVEGRRLEVGQTMISRKKVLS